MMKTQSLYTLSVVLLLISCRSVSDTPKTKNRIDTLMFDTFNKGFTEWGTNLTLTKEWTFKHEEYHYSDYVQKGEPTGWIKQITGSFKIDSNRIHLNPTNYLTKELFENKSVTIDSLNYFESDSTHIKTVFTLIKWTGNLYLLSEETSFEFGYRRDNDFVKFADNYNSGSEPRWSQPYFAKRSSKERAEKLDLSQIPLQWRGYFLDKPIRIVVTDIEKDIFYDSIYNTSINLFKLNGGEKQGVRAGMTFYGKAGCCTIKIMDADEDGSKGLIELCPYDQNSCKIGDTLISWNEKDYGKYVP